MVDFKTMAYGKIENASVHLECLRNNVVNPSLLKKYVGVSG